MSPQSFYISMSPMMSKTNLFCFKKNNQTNHCSKPRHTSSCFEARAVTSCSAADFTFWTSCCAFCSSTAWSGAPGRHGARGARGTASQGVVCCTQTRHDCQRLNETSLRKSRGKMRRKFFGAKYPKKQLIFPKEQSWSRNVSTSFCSCIQLPPWEVMGR